jgi:CBS domain-containing protein
MKADLTSSPFLTVSPDTSPGEALAALTAAGIGLGLVGDKAAPVTLVSEDDLLRLAGAAAGRLRDLADRLPAAVLVPEVTGVSVADIQAYALLLEDTGAPGLMVLGAEGVVSAVSAATVAEVLRRVSSIRVRGVPDVMGPAFVCTKHQPPLYLYPRTGDKVPRCPGDPLHGRMDRADL